jgi:hypothetical protein
LEFAIGRFEQIPGQFLEITFLGFVDIALVIFGKAINEKCKVVFLEQDDGSVTARFTLVGSCDPLFDNSP